MSSYLGIQEQKRRNSWLSMLLLLMFPIVLLLMFWLACLVRFRQHENTLELAGGTTAVAAPVILIAVSAWFLIAWARHRTFLLKSTGAVPLERKKHRRVYNLVENLCISRGMRQPEIYLIDDPSLNAYAGGLTSSASFIALSAGLVEALDDNELEAVIAHELSHIQNKDTRLLTIAIIFVGIFSFLLELVIRAASRTSSRKGGLLSLVLIMVLAALGYLVSLLIRFALSRKREFLADASAVEWTRNSDALAKALEKIAADPCIEAIRRRDVAQLFIENPQMKTSWFDGLFATHPPIKERIRFLRQL